MNPSVETVSLALFRAFRGGPALDSARMSSLVTSAQDAYAVQDALVHALDAQRPGPGAPPAWKSGGPSRTATLTHSRLPCAGVRPSGSNMRDLHLRQPGIEAEVALRLSREIDAQEAATLTREDAARLIDAMCVSIEVVDSRWVDGKSAPALLKLADLQSHGALVLGEWIGFEDRDWSRQPCRVRVGGAGWQQFQGTHSLADPTWVLPAWLRHATRSESSVPAGTVVTTGTWCGWLDASPGDRVEVEFPGIGGAVVEL